MPQLAALDFATHYISDAECAAIARMTGGQGETWAAGQTLTVQGAQGPSMRLKTHGDSTQLCSGWLAAAAHRQVCSFCPGRCCCQTPVQNSVHVCRPFHISSSFTMSHNVPCRPDSAGPRLHSRLHVGRSQPHVRPEEPGAPQADEQQPQLSCRWVGSSNSSNSLRILRVEAATMVTWPGRAR